MICSVINKKELFCKKNLGNTHFIVNSEKYQVDERHEHYNYKRLNN